jgi:muramoyltetrapeptide carboxypeptidase
MNRKKFLASIVPLAAMASSLGQKKINILADKNSKIPPYLKKGDTIGITSSAGYITLADCAEAISTIEKWGYKLKIGNTIGKKYFTFGGTDEERLADLQQMLDDDTLKAIMIARGGYGFVHIIDKIDFTKFTKKPKWLIGFSDVTVLHSHVNKNFGIATLHSKMCNSFVKPELAEPAQLETIDSIRKCISGEKMIYKAPVNINNKIGTSSGILVGGNLKTLESLAASKSDINTDNKILFVEDTGEYLYSIDRMFYNLKRSGKLQKLAGLVVGGFKIKKDEGTEDFGKTLEEIVLEKITEFKYPVCFDFPVGHQKNNFALKCGVEHKLDVTALESSLKEK